MGEIQKVAVVGSGVMGAGIAAHIANSGTEVLLLDIVPEGSKSRNALAEKALERLRKENPAPITHSRVLKKITPGNLEDDLPKIKECDWIIEVIVEKLEVKQELYRKVNGYRKKGSIVSSNTSTIPLHQLTQGMPASFQQEFVITHFFNPPRYMRLLELVTGPQTNKKIAETIRNFCDVKLGKGVVECKDTPGFIANRIGVFWLMTALRKAIELGVTVEQADAVMGKPVGIPKTAVFGLFDLIGIDLMPLIASEMLKTLPQQDAFRSMYQVPDVVQKMLKEGYTGRKGKGGFYRLNTEGGKKAKEVINLKTGEYAPQSKDTKLDSAEAARDGLRKLVTHPDIGGKYAWEVLRETLLYTASLVPEISEDIYSVDQAMKLGYNWKYGPFELIDRLGTESESGTAWFAKKLAEEGKPIPAILKAANGQPFYQRGDRGKQFFTLGGNYHAFPHRPDVWMLGDITEGKKPIAKNPSARIWDVGDGVICFEHTSKMNSFDPMTFEMLHTAIDTIKKGHRALIIGNDSENFSVGANLGFVLYAANLAAWKMIEDIIKQGQDTFMALKYAPFPVVGAPSGMALGGGCEILLHCDAVNAHIELYTGLVEVGVGFVPGWGGCKEMVLRQLAARRKDQRAAAKLGGMFAFIPPVKVLNTMPALAKAFETISTAKVSKSAEEARDMLILNEKSRITMNRERVLPDAKKLALDLARDYQVPQQIAVNLPGKTARAAFNMAVENFVKSGKATE